MRLRTPLVLIAIGAWLPLGCASRTTAGSAKITGATSRPLVQSKAPSAADPFKKLRDALDAATRKTPPRGAAPSRSTQEAGLIGRADPPAVGTTGRDTDALAGEHRDTPADALGTDSGATSADAAAARNTDPAAATDRTRLRIAGIALVLVGLALGLFAYLRRGTRA